MTDRFIFTSESVTIGHPDKLCDQISDAIVDAYLRRDPSALINAESAVSSGVLFISTHYASTASIAIPDIARRVIREVGYTRQVFDADACTIMTSFMDHTATHYHCVDLGSLDDDGIDKLSARHQATVFGYACDQTDQLMPIPVVLAHRLAGALDRPELEEELPYLLPDGSAQVGIEYEDGRPKRIHSIILIASQSAESEVDPADMERDLVERVVTPVLAKERLQADEGTRVFVNPQGPIIGGGPAVHSGLTGRKTSIDTYGEWARHSGAALSGKDPMRIDRVGAYVARYAAKNVVAAGLARECEVALSYSIGSAAPVSVRLRTFGTGSLSDEEIQQRVSDTFDFRVGAVVRDLGLRDLPSRQHGFYQRLAVYGHMGREDLEAPWEATDKVSALK